MSCCTALATNVVFQVTPMETDGPSPPTTDRLMVPPGDEDVLAAGSGGATARVSVNAAVTVDSCKSSEGDEGGVGAAAEEGVQSAAERGAGMVEGSTARVGPERAKEGRRVVLAPICEVESLGVQGLNM